MPHGERIGEETAVRRLLQAWEVDLDQNTDMGGEGQAHLNMLEINQEARKEVFLVLDRQVLGS